MHTFDVSDHADADEGFGNSDDAGELPRKGADGADDDLIPDLLMPPVAPEFDELGPTLDDDVVDALDDDFDDDDDIDEDEDDSDGDEDGDAPARAAKAAPKKRKPTDEDEEVALPDTPVPTDKKMLAALEAAFEGQDDVDAALLAGFTKHALALLEQNRVMNLTAITDPKEVAVKHYLDSWRITRMVPLMARRVLDLGSGGGFPGIPIALAEPMCSVILCESITKKAKFLEEVIAKLGLRNVRVVNERAEDYLARERVDIVVIRAVSSVRENIRTLRKVRHAMQDLVMFKGNSWGREVRAAEREAERLGFKLDTVMEHELPDDMGRHAILVYRAPGGAGM
ncbi:MAG: 16S rRNA (guanine(527)-N(7))-methyltransferase RsmG [Planctomycetota bacterium]